MSIIFYARQNIKENADAAVHVLVLQVMLLQVRCNKYLYLLYRDLSEGHLSIDDPACIWSLNIHSVCGCIHKILHKKYMQCYSQSQICLRHAMHRLIIEECDCSGACYQKYIPAVT